jgi:hypothetical protein
MAQVEEGNSILHFHPAADYSSVVELAGCLVDALRHANDRGLDRCCDHCGFSGLAAHLATVSVSTYFSAVAGIGAA